MLPVLYTLLLSALDPEEVRLARSRKSGTRSFSITYGINKMLSHGSAIIAGSVKASSLGRAEMSISDFLQLWRIQHLLVLLQT